VPITPWTIRHGANTRSSTPSRVGVPRRTADRVHPSRTRRRAAEAKRKGLTNVRFLNQDAATLDGSEQYDFITTFDAVHDQARPDLVLSAIAGSLRPGGQYLCVDIAASSAVAGNVAHPLAPFLYTVSCMHCMTVSLAAGGMGLGTMWGEQKARQMLADAGFDKVETKHVEGDIFNNYYVATRV
jgi:2-polyprenyl-3-methyl-5-hydroxy-6-metoxy-1,4-benzoquinol methylase